MHAKKLSFPFIILGIKEMIPNLDSSKVQQKDETKFDLILNTLQVEILPRVKLSILP